MRYEDYRGPEIPEKPAPSVSLPARIGNLLTTIYFTMAAIGFWLSWREGGDGVDYYGSYAFTAMTALSLPPLGTALQRRLSRRAARWIRWGGCFLIYLIWALAIAA